MSQKFSATLHGRITCRSDSAVLMILCLTPSLKMEETEPWYLVRTPVTARDAGWRLCGCSSHRAHYCNVSETVKETFRSFHTTKHHDMWNFSPCGTTARIWPRPSILKFLDHTQLVSLSHTHTHTERHTQAHTDTHTHRHTHTHTDTHRHTHTHTDTHTDTHTHTHADTHTHTHTQTR